MSASGAPRARALVVGLALAGALVGAGLGCAGGAIESVSGFLGDYRRLEPEAGEARDVADPSLVSLDPAADFGRYDEVQIEPVTVWLAQGSALDGALLQDLERLVDRLEAALRRQVGQEFIVVERPGPGTLRLRVALSEKAGAEAMLDVASSVPTRGTLPDPSTSLAAATRAFVAKAALEVEALDALSNRRLGAAVDPEAAPRLLERDVTSWGDVEEAWDAWADGLQAALAAFRRTARGDPPP